MDEIRYLISDASKKVDVETHVLRYWEEELGISIPRNEMGHRYYTEFHIQLFCQVKKLKDKGYQLKAIKNALQQVMAHNQGLTETGIFLEEDMSRTLVRGGLRRDGEKRQETDAGNAVANANAANTNAANGLSLLEMVETGVGELTARNGDLPLVDTDMLELEGDMYPDGEEGLSEAENLQAEEVWDEEESEDEESLNDTDSLSQDECRYEMNHADDADWELDLGSGGYLDAEAADDREVLDEENLHNDEELNLERMEDAAHCGPVNSAGIMRLADYSRLEPAAVQRVKSVLWSRRKIQGEELKSTQEKVQEKEVTVRSERDQQEEASAAEGKDNVLKSGEIMKEDGQSDMKNRVKNGKKHSAWERRKGMLAGEKGDQQEILDNVAESSLGTGQESANLESETGENDGKPAEKNLGRARGGVFQSEELASQQEMEEAVLAGEDMQDDSTCFAVVSRDEKMQQFQEIMNHIIGRALEVNNEKLSNEISDIVNQRLTEELEDLMRIRDEREEERYRQLDEVIRSFQRESQGKAEAAATRIPFFRKKRFGRNGKQIKK